MTGTKIQWTEETWNPIAGCSVVSPGCTNCYAMRRTAPRLSNNQATPHYHGTVQPSKGGYVWTGKIGIAGDTAFLKPLRIKRPTMFFVNSMSDLFHENVPDEVIDRIFAIMALCTQHTFQVLTKRSARMRQYTSDPDTPRRVYEIVCDMVVEGELPAVLRLDGIDDPGIKPSWPRIFLGAWPLANIWLGVSVEDQARADERIPDLLATPAAIRFISAEPLLGPLDVLPYLFIYTQEDDRLLGAAPASELPELPFRDPESTPASDIATPRVDWVIVGGESGKGARPMHPDWARDIRDQCAAAGVPFFFKQWGAWTPGENAGPPPKRTETAATYFDEGWTNPGWHQQRITARQSQEMHRNDEPDVYLVGAKRAGRLLDGVEHNAMPGDRP